MHILHIPPYRSVLSMNGNDGVEVNFSLSPRDVWK